MLAALETLAEAAREGPDGARIAYTSDDPALVGALHRWGDARVGDHGATATTVTTPSTSATTTADRWQGVAAGVRSANRVDPAGWSDL